jgi:tetratricopeptide (TPR) repeat protein
MNCLKATIASQPTNAAVLGAQSQMALLGGDQPSTENALVLAGKAVSADPLSDRARLAMARSQFAGGSVDAAIASANRAMELNPNNPDVAGTLAMLLFAGGYWQAANDMAADAGRIPELAPPDALLVKALSAYHRGGWSNAVRIVAQDQPADATAAMVEAAALGQLGAADAKQKLAELRTLVPDFETSFRARMESQRHRPEVTAPIKDGLGRTGANFKPKPTATANAF